MGETFDKHDQTLLLLVMNLQSSALVQLGKLADPATGETRRDLDAARLTIDLLEMLRAKCREIPAEVKSLLDRTVMDLHLNFADEARKDADAEATPPDDAAAKPARDETATPATDAPDDEK